ncbi:MAG: hypothetical protein ABS49_11620 [Erythrobacter sp. SCN 62-14]|nr:MAG: hypothetical protein ABS49_11620 [Erythrobacter sp. SCN 62-14]
MQAQEEKNRLSVSEARADIGRTLKIEPKLTEIYLFTTAPDDLTLDKLAIEIRQEQANLGRAVQVHIWGLDKLQRRIRLYADAVRAFDPDYSASTDELIELGRENLEVGRETAAEFAAVRAGQQVMAGNVEQILAIVRSVDRGSGAALDRVIRSSPIPPLSPTPSS